MTPKLEEHIVRGETYLWMQLHHVSLANLASLLVLEMEMMKHS